MILGIDTTHLQLGHGLMLLLMFDDTGECSITSSNVYITYQDQLGNTDRQGMVSVQRTCNTNISIR